MVELPGYDSATIKVDETGTVWAYVSCPSQGQGHETVFAQLVAAALGVDPAMVVIAPADTDLAPAGSGTFGSRPVVAGGGAPAGAADRIKAEAGGVSGPPPAAAPPRG